MGVGEGREEERRRRRHKKVFALAAGCNVTGFDHSAFTFSYEAYLSQAQISPTEIPPGALVTFLQKGLQFLEIEANLNDVRGKCRNMCEVAELSLYIHMCTYMVGRAWFITKVGFLSSKS